MKNTQFWIGSILFVLLIALQGCVNSKGETTKFGKAYHNLTGKYNAYYNADLRLIKSYETLNGQHQDNYNKLLPMYPYAAVADANAAKGPLDEAIKKLSANIELHRVSNWADDSYLLLGQAEYLKKEYEKAAATFKYIVDKYDPEKLAEEAEAAKKKRKKKKRKKKKRKKKKKKKKKPEDTGDPEDEKPKKYVLKHRPIWYDATLWLAQSYIEIGMYDDAGMYLRIMEEDKRVPKKLRGQIQALMAYSELKQGNNEKAIAPLELAVERTRRKVVKNRYVYLLAQLYQEQGNNELAMKNFKKVLKLHPTYEMEFNARLNMAKNASMVEEVKLNPEMAVRKMIRDPKNEEYKDQLYFALAEILLNNGEKQEGIKTLQLSLASGANDFQRVEACILLADLFFEEENYVEAYAYYDSTLMVMKKEDDRHLATNQRKDQLEGIATNLNTITLKDSLLAVANKSPEGQKQWAQKMRLEEAALKSTAGPKNSGKLNGKSISKNAFGSKNTSSGGLTSISQNAINKSSFELYDPNLIKKGQRDFEKRWGNRPWADNWRQSSGNGFTDNDTTSAKGSDALPPMTEQDVQKYLKEKKIPLSETEQKQTNDAIMLAYFKLGVNYRERLQDDDKALKAFQTLLERYPDSKKELETWYMIYSIYEGKRNFPEAQKYQEKILEKYPDSDIAKALKDPNFLNAKQQQIKDLNTEYDLVQQMISDRKFAEARTKIKAVPANFGGDNTLKARFALLEAMCVGGTEGVEAYKKALKSVAASFPKTPEEEQAKKMLAVLGETISSNPKTNPKTDTKSDQKLFDTNKNTGHYILIVFKNKKAPVNNFKGSVSDFNKANFSLLRLSVSPILLDGSMPALVVRKFKNGELAGNYYKSATTDANFMKGVSEAYDVYYINQNNYRVILQKNNFSAYTTFFKENLVE